MTQTRKLGVVNFDKSAKVHVITAHLNDPETLFTGCGLQDVVRLVEVDPSESDRLCKHCFARRPLPWGGTT